MQLTSNKAVIDFDMTFYIVPLTSQEIADGKLIMIGNAITNASIESIRRVAANGQRGDVKNMLVHFENSLTNENFDSEYGSDIMDVLYLNEDAKTIVETAGIKLLLKGTTETIPSTAGLHSSMPY